MNNNRVLSLLHSKFRLQRIHLRFFTVILLILVGAFLVSTSGSVYSQMHDPIIAVLINQNNVGGFHWPEGTQLTLAVDDPETLNNPDYTEIQTVITDDGWTSVWFSPGESFTLQPGYLVTITDGITTKEHTITNLVVTAADIAADKIWGTADPGTLVMIQLQGDTLIYREEIADGAGNWLADFSIEGDEPGEDIYDLDQASILMVTQTDADGHTQIDWQAPNPTFSAHPEDDSIHSWGWIEGTTISLSIDDPATNEILDYTDAQIAHVADWDPNQVFVEFNFQGIYDLKAGDVVQLTDGIITKIHTVTDLAISAVDPSDDTVSGTAVSGTELDVWIHEPDSPNIHLTADASGDWTADFFGQWDLVPGTNGAVQQNDEDGDGTWVGWGIPNPTFAVRPDGDNVDGWEWSSDTDVTIIVNGQFAATAHTDEWGNFNTSLWDKFDIVPGAFVEISDGVSQKDHTVTILAITSVDVSTEVVTGIAGPNSSIQVWTDCGEYGCIHRSTTADGNGNWLVDFSVPGGEGEEQIVDIQPGYWVDSGEWDEDGDNTNAGYNVPNPHFAVRLFDAQVEGWEWPLGANVTMTIDDPDTPQNPDYEDAQTVVAADWDPNQTHVQFDFNYVHFIEPGHEVTLSDGETTKTHTVIDLGITDVDEFADTVAGTAVPFTQVDAWICDDWGCANRHITADAGGNWLADFANPGPQGDEQDTYDIIPGTRGDVSQSDEDGDSTQIWWNISNPRVEVSYEHNWVQISGFTPDGQVTYTIYDYEGGHALFGPVTGPVDPHGNGWISQNLFHTDLVPGMYVTAVDETTGEEVSLTIREVNLDYISADDDRAFGTAEPNTTIELNVNETNNDGFQLMVDVDSNGYWEVDLVAAGYPLNEYRHASANLYDAEGDNIVAQNPRLHAQVTTDNISVDNFSKNADVTFTLYDAPGGNILYGPEILHTDSSGNAGVNLWDYGVDLQVGHTFVAYDHALAVTKTLVIEPFTFEEMNVADDTVRGTSAVGEWVDLHVESLFSNWGMNALTDENNQWFADYASDGYDITEQMWAHGWAVDNQGNWSEDHITGLPNIEASTTGDWISGWNFSPDRSVHIEIYDEEGGVLLTQFDTTTDGNTQFHADYWQHEIDLQPDMFILVQDTETGKSASLTLVYLTFDGINYDTETAWGQADAGSQVVVRASSFFEGYETAVTTDSSGNWFADFSQFGVDLTADWGLRAYVYDLELDANIADAPQLPQFTAGLDGDWINGNNWTGGGTVQISVWDQDDNIVLDAFAWETDPQGNFHIDLWEQNLDLQPGYHIVVYEVASGQEKALTLSELSIEFVDFDQDLVGGLALADTRLTVGFGNQDSYLEFDLFSEADGNWLADFGIHDFDLQPDMWGNARIVDDDGDATQVGTNFTDPTLHVVPAYPEIHGHDWSRDALVTITIDDDGDPANGVLYEATKAVNDDPWCGEPCFDLTGAFDIQVGQIVSMSDGAITKTVTVTALQITMASAETDTVSGTAVPFSEVQVDIHEMNGASRRVTADANGNWMADFSVPGDEDWEQDTFDLLPGTGGRAIQHETDASDDGTLAYWSVLEPPFECEPGDTVSGFVYEGDGLTPIAEAEVHFDDYFTGQPLYYTITDGSGAYSCSLPEGDYRIWAFGGRYSREYYEETIFEHASLVQVSTDAQITGVDFTLDMPFDIVDSLIFNMENDLTSDIAVRQAIAFGTNRLAMITASFPASPLLDSYLAPDHWAYAGEGLMQYNFDPDLARMILEQAGWVDEDGDGIRERDGQRLSFRYVTTIVPTGHFRETIALLFAENMADIGIEVDVQFVPAPWDEIQQDAAVGVAQFAWLDDVNAEMSRDSVWWVFHSDAGSNPGHCYNPTADQLLNLLELFGTRTEMFPFLQQHQIAVMADLAMLPLVQRVQDEASPLSTFVALGEEGVYLKQGGTVVSGDVGANTAVIGPYLSDDAEVVIGTHVTFLNLTSRLMGDSLRIKEDAQVYDVYYNTLDLDGNTSILGVNFTPQSLPLVPTLPEVPDFEPGVVDLEVSKNEPLTLDAGSYGLLEAGKGATIIFTGGVYNFAEWDIGQDVNLFFEAPSEVRVAGKVQVDKGSYIGPAAGIEGVGVPDIVFYILGVNGNDGGINASPKAAVFGLDNTLNANIYVPYGTLHIRQGSDAVGAFLGKWVLIGNSVTLTLDSGW